MADTYTLFAQTDESAPALIKVTPQEILDDNEAQGYGNLTVFGTGVLAPTTPAPVIINPFAGAGLALNTTPSGVTGNIQFDIAGTWLVIAAISGFDPIAGNTQYTMQIGFNGAPTPSGCRFSHGTIAQPNGGACSHIVAAVPGDTVQLMLASPAGAGLTVTEASLSVQRVGA